VRNGASFPGGRQRAGTLTVFPALVMASGVVWAGCGNAPAPDGAPAAATPPAAPPLTVYVGAYPLEYFASRIGGERVAVHLPAPPGMDPSLWSPEPEEVLAYQNADLILLNGADFEGWVATASLPASRTVDTTAELADEIIVVEDAYSHSHGDQGHHSHDVTASVTWLDLPLAVRQAEVVMNALAHEEPENAGAFAARFLELIGDLEALDARLRAVADGARGRRLLAAAPGFEYLARAYRLELEPIRFDAGASSLHDFWHDLDHGIRHGAGSAMLWSGEPPAEVRERLEEMGIQVVIFDPAAGRPLEGDFLSVMEGNVERLRGALGGEG